MLGRRLGRLGFEILVARDGQEAVNRAHQDQPDIILMDMSLPVIDGWEATRQIKADDATRSIPVIGLSAHALSDDRNRALEMGCDDYETKPVHLNRLLAKIDKLTAKDNPDDQLDRPVTGS